MNPRENLLRTLRCDGPEWIPVCPHLFWEENPTVGVPEELTDVFSLRSGILAKDILALGEYFGLKDFMLPVPDPAKLISKTCQTETDKVTEGKYVTTISTPKGELQQVMERRPGSPALVTERYVKTAEDAVILTEYFDSLDIQVLPGALAEIQTVQELAGEKALLFCRTMGTPMGMCYRVYSDIVSLVYLIADAPSVAEALFASMEEKFLLLYETMLQQAPAIDAFLGMDDTSTTLISPDMFDAFNVDLTNRRAELCHKHERLYLHHSCGLIRDLLPVYRKTSMDGVDALTRPPIGDVGFSQARDLLGPGYSMSCSLSSGLPSMDEDVIRRHVAEAIEDAEKAGNVVFHVGGSELTFQAMEDIFRAAER